MGAVHQPAPRARDAVGLKRIGRWRQGALAAFDLAQAADRAWRTGETQTLTPLRTPDRVDYAAGS